MKQDPEEFHEIADELRGIIRGHRDLLNNEARIMNPLKEALNAARIKIEDLPHPDGLG